MEQMKHDCFPAKFACRIKEGESLLFKPDGSGSLKPVARVQASDWIALSHSR
jgi:hypothetical protein